MPDGEPGGEPIVQNGIALCTLHHAAFDRFIMGIRPDYVVQIKSSIMKEQNGPVLTHGLKGVHGMRITLPRHAVSKPDPKLLEWRWKRFRQQPKSRMMFGPGFEHKKVGDLVASLYRCY